MSFLVWINDESWWLFTGIIGILAIWAYRWINIQARIISWLTRRDG